MSRTLSKSIVILDNCSVHHVPEVFAILLFFLPPYSPDYNPIEEVFSYVKGYLRHHDNLIHDPTVVIREAFNLIMTVMFGSPIVVTIKCIISTIIYHFIHQ